MLKRGILLLCICMALLPVSLYAATPTSDSILLLLKLIKKNQKKIASEEAQIKQLMVTKPIPTLPFIHFIRITSNQMPVLDQSINNTGTQVALSFGVPKAQLGLGGRISAMPLYANDGQSNDLFFTTNSAAKTEFFIDTLFQPTEGWTLGSNVELEMDYNASDTVSQTVPSPTPSVDINKAEVYVISKKVGAIFLGIGDSASDDTVHSDLSGTALAGRATTEDIGGGLFFRNKNTGSLSSVMVSNAVNGLNGLANQARIRYTTPEFGGFTVSASALEDGQEDLALKYGHEFGRTKFAIQFACTTSQDFNADTPYAMEGESIDGSSSILFPVGISLTGAMGEAFMQQPVRNNAYYFYVKPGYQHQFSKIGITAFSVDMGRYYNFAFTSDVAPSYGVQVLQYIEPWNLIVYAGYRNFGLSAPDSGASYDNINLGFVGVLYKF